MAAKKRGELIDLIPAYAIGALDEDDRAEFEAWLHQDQEAQSLLADYRAVADHLVALAPLRAAPRHLQDDLRQRLAASRNHPTAAELKLTRKPSKRRMAWLLAAAVVAVVLAAVILVHVNSDDPISKSKAEQLYTRLVAQPDSAQYEIVAGEVDAAVSGSLIVSPDGRRAVLRVAYLPPITSDQTFQMWLIDTAGTRTSAGLFRANPAQEALYIEVPFERPVIAYQGVGVSLEPAGGSPYNDQPTGPRVLSVPLGG